MNDGKSLIAFMKDFLPKIALGKVKITGWGWWRGGVDGTFRLMIDWKEKE